MKIYYHGKLITTKWYRFTSFMKQLAKTLTILAIITGSLYASFSIGRVTTVPVTVFAEKEVIKTVKDDTLPPILLKIFDCESGKRDLKNRAYKGTASHRRNGQVLINASEDMGIAQINVAIHSKDATKMGYDLSIEKDNIAFAKHLYHTQGSEPWSASRKCWVQPYAIN